MGMMHQENGIGEKIARLQEQLQGAKDALALQAREYERRLDILNNEADRLRDIQATYLPRELYEAGHRELTTKIESLQKMVFIGLGIILAVEALLRFIK